MIGITEQQLTVLALYIASIRETAPELANYLEQTLYVLATEKLQESRVRYLLELTETRVYH